MCNRGGALVGARESVFKVHLLVTPVVFTEMSFFQGAALIP